MSKLSLSVQAPPKAKPVGDTQVARLSAAANALVAIESPRDAMRVMRLAEAARVYARQMKLGYEAQNAATAIRLVAEVRLAETVTEGQDRGEIATDGRPETVRTPDGFTPSRLADLGVDRQRLAEARSIAATFTVPAIEGMVAEANEKGRELTRGSVLREAQIRADETLGRAVHTVEDDRLQRYRHLLVLLGDADRLIRSLRDGLGRDERQQVGALLTACRRDLGTVGTLEVIGEAVG